MHLHSPDIKTTWKERLKLAYKEGNALFSKMIFFCHLVAVYSPTVEISGQRLNVQWQRPQKANPLMKLSYKVKVQVGEEKSFSSGELDSTYYSYRS